MKDHHSREDHLWSWATAFQAASLAPCEDLAKGWYEGAKETDKEWREWLGGLQGKHSNLRYTHWRNAAFCQDIWAALNQFQETE